MQLSGMMMRSTDELSGRARARRPYSPAPKCVRPHDPRQACHLLRQPRIAFVRHGGRALLPLCEVFLDLQDFGPLEIAQFVAKFSSDPAMMASVVRNCACRSRAIT